jgi:hypothetical protein
MPKERITLPPTNGVASPNRGAPNSGWLTLSDWIWPARVLPRRRRWRWETHGFPGCESAEQVGGHGRSLIYGSLTARSLTHPNCSVARIDSHARARERESVCVRKSWNRGSLNRLALVELPERMGRLSFCNVRGVIFTR